MPSTDLALVWRRRYFVVRFEMGSSTDCFVYCTVREEPETRSVTQEASGTTPPHE